MAPATASEPELMKSQLEVEIAATKSIYAALLSVEEERRYDVLQAVAVLLNIRPARRY